MKYIISILWAVTLAASAVTPVTDLKLYGAANANTNRITNATDFVSANGVSLTNLAAQTSVVGALTNYQHNAILGGLTVSNALQFGATPSVTTNARSMYWDVDEHTVSVPMESGGVVGQMFKEGYIYGQNKAGRTVTNGTAVKIVADPGGTGIRFDLASSTNNVGRGHFIGLVTQSTITNNGYGYVTTWGEVHDVNTAAFTNGDDLYLDGDGIITNIPPSPPAYPVHVGYVVRSHASLGVVYVRGGNVELDPVWSTVSNSVATSIAGKLATNGVQAGGLGGVLITNAGGIVYVSATNTGGGGGSGTLTGVVVGAGSSTRLTATNSGSANATINLDESGLAVLSGGNVFLGSNVVSGLSISTNTSGQVKLNLIDGSGQDTINIMAGGFRSGIQPVSGARITLQSTNAGGSFVLATTASRGDGTISAASNMSIIAGSGAFTFAASQGASLGGMNLTNIGHIMSTGLLQTAGSENLYAPLYVGAITAVSSNANPNSGAINTMPTYFDVRAWADPVIRHYVNTTNMDEFPRYAGEFWNYSNLSSNFPSQFGVGIRMGPHSATSAVYFASIETRASGTNDLHGRLSIQLASSSIGSTTTRREVAYFDSARNMVVSGRVTATSFAGDGSALTGISGGGASLTTNAVIKLPAMRGFWDVSSDVPTSGGGAMAFEQPFSTSTAYRASFRTISTAAVSRVIQGAPVALSSVETNWVWFDIDHVGTNAATIQFTADGSTNVLFSQNLTTTGVYRVNGTNAAGNRELVPYLYTTNTGPGTTNFSRTWMPVIRAVVQ